LTRIDFGTLPTNLLTGFEAWAWAFGLDPSSQNLDADADGVSNLAEYLAGSNPSDAASQFLLRIGRTPTNTRVSFDALRAEGIGYEGRTRHYALERRGQLPSGSWQAVPGFSDLVGNNQVVVYDAPGADAPWFFRGSVWLDTAGNVVPAEFRLVLSHNAGQTTISFTALGQDALGRNRYHTLERSTNRVGGLWFALPGCSNVLGSNQTVKLSDTHSAQGPVFYRGRYELRNP
jgi:hypothetical protein